MHIWGKRIFMAAAPLLLTGCLWGPGKFASDLTLKKDGSFVLDYRGEIVLQTPPDAEAKAEPWSTEKARCRKSGKVEVQAWLPPVDDDDKDEVRPCTPTELAKAKTDFEKQAAERAKSKREDTEQMAKLFGMPGFDDESSRAFAAKLGKYAGYRSVQYRGRGVYDVDYHFEGRATQDFVFPALPDNDFIIPFIAIRRRKDGSVFVTAPAFTGRAGPLGARAGAAAASQMKDGPVSKAQGRFIIITDGEVLTNNSEDGTAPHALGRQVHWDVGPGSSKIPEALVRLQ
ncbi:hypothetical protein LZ016_06385 [Sphingomonas sp. SM33]|uniref:Lipoprotein n=1 Tax=Sphingomonas telluris TaxID=2907998 RepID=A0ABS9VL76_9SPHN|nr:hypothetical protein [Sphingomonas telluris]MCH8615727.1 hypothetical protein [Sphingomonas telluris]